MKFTFDRDALLKEISIAQEIIATKNAISILSNVLLDAQNGKLTIKATDIKVSFETSLPVDVQEPGSTTVFCDKFAGIISSLPQGEIEFEQNDIKITIKPFAKKAKFQLKSITSDKFPEFTSSGTLSFFDIPAKEFREMINQTIFSVSDDETRYFMNGVFMEKQNDELKMVATDGRRLAFISKPVGAAVPDFKGIIIPPKILNIVNKRLSDEGPVSVAVGEKNVFFRFGNYEFSSALIEGQFPNYERVIPASQTSSFEVDAKELLDALKRVSLLVEQKSRRISFTITPGVLIINSQESEIGNAKEEIPCRYDGPEQTMALNYVYIEDPVKVIGTERVKIEFTEPMKAITIKPQPEKDFFHIVMPMQME
ncbi:DNA polymerase III subunit beta [Brucepastera parasyntrophica]|uniref:DNA polymerase III subunit beta n=1 Tax=Brucepastera parasyntrophica TaxID=2880008 RepID=UPI0021095C89|nr:DNA polymerase III subunit beta [Brucepastera parasyntrophica]ULQ58618.1 DNA polymerase III subunit beta [Brucepastera parasyntrophica]